jgi:threonine/homoserine/homoserine lactone efflux protein
MESNEHKTVFTNMSLDFIPQLPLLAGYIAGIFIIAITPGPDMTYFLGRTIAQGVPAGISAVLGATSGILVHSVLVAFGLSALVIASPILFLVLKIAGAVYLLWLAIDALRHGSAFEFSNVSRTSRSLKQVWMQGLLINLLNPKIILFFMTFLPQFVTATDANAPAQLLFLGLLFYVLALPLTLPMVLAAGALTNFFRRSPRATRMIDYAFATIFGAFAIRILLTERV